MYKYMVTNQCIDQIHIMLFKGGMGRTLIVTYIRSKYTIKLS